MCLSDGDITKLNVCWNNVSRKIFQMNIWESVKPIQFYCGRLDLIHIVHKNQMNFLCWLNRCMNPVVLACLNHFPRSALFFSYFCIV